MRRFTPASTPTVAVAALLALHAGLQLSALRRTFITVDEIGHVVAGISYWRTGRFLVDRVNPPLPKALAVLPALAAGPRTDFGGLRDIPSERAEYQLSGPFASANKDRLFDLVCLARLTGVAWSILGGWLVYWWGRELYGDAAGVLAVGLWCVEPFVLGHAALVTADVPSATAGLAASYAFWRYLRSPSWSRAGLAGALLGVAALTKFTLLVFFPLWPALWLSDRLLARDSWPRLPSLRTEAGPLLLIAATSLSVINLGYAGRGACLPLGDYPFVSRLLSGRGVGHGVSEGRPGNRFRGSWLGAVPVPLPEDVLRGIDVQRVDFESSPPSYLGGRWRDGGWWYYYLYGLGVKLPLGTLGLILWGIATTIFGRGVRGPRGGPFLLATAVAILVLVGSQTGRSHHVRYAIPALPFLMISAGAVVSEPGRGRRWRLLVAWALLLGAAVSSLSVYPHSLSYFNEVAGGPDNGHDHLLDSNIDWGQDLLYLKQWLEAHPEARPIRLAYFNVVDAGLIGLRFELPPPGHKSKGSDPATTWRAIGPMPGYYAVSVNFLRGFGFFAPDGQGGLHLVEPHEFEYFRAFRPIAKAGYSIYIYRITPEQADAERRRHGLESITNDQSGASGKRTAVDHRT